MPGGYGSSRANQDYWLSHRSRLDDLYESERHFFEPAVRRVRSVLDVGCAAGGGALFCREANPGIAYTGVDVSEGLVEAAKSRGLAGAEFLRYNGERLPFPEGAFDLVFSFGVLHHVPQWRRVVADMAAKASRFVLFDLRLTPGEAIESPELSYQETPRDGVLDTGTRVPYLVPNLDEAAAFVSGLLGPDDRLSVFGGAGKPNAITVTPVKSVFMLAFCIEKFRGQAA